LYVIYVPLMIGEIGRESLSGKGTINPLQTNAYKKRRPSITGRTGGTGGIPHFPKVPL